MSERDDLQHAAELLGRLIPQATPGPWRDSTVDSNRYGALIADTCTRDCDKHEFSSDEDHRRLAEVLHSTPATVLLSGYDSPLYDELYGDWHRTARRVLRRSSNGRSAAQVHAMEHVWSNRPLRALPPPVHAAIRPAEQGNLL